MTIITIDFTIISKNTWEFIKRDLIIIGYNNQNHSMLAYRVLGQ